MSTAVKVLLAFAVVVAAFMLYGVVVTALHYLVIGVIVLAIGYGVYKIANSTRALGGNGRSLP